MPSISALSELEAILHDGETAAAHPARARLTDAGLTLLRADAAPEPLAFSALRLVDRTPDRCVLRHATRPGWRLVISGELPPDWLQQLRRAARPTPRRVALWGGAGAVAAGLVAVIVLNAGAILATLAPLLPHSWTEPMGRQMIGIISSGKECSGQAGHRALENLAARLRPEGGFAEPVTLHVIQSPVDNAFALPGGHVVLLSSLIEKAETPEEVAGVLAHELGHAHHRHSNQALIRHFGAGLFLQALGGDMGAMANTTLMLGHSREAEREADAFAIAQLRQAGISPQGLADFFARHQADDEAQEDGPEGEKAEGASFVKDALRTLRDYAATHPASSTREARFRAAAKATAQPRPALGEAEWLAVRGICEKSADDAR